MWKIVKNKFKNNNIYSNCTQALAHCHHEPQLFYQREISHDNRRFNILPYADILVGIKIPRVDKRYWGFSSEMAILSLEIDNETLSLEIMPDKFIYLLKGTHPLVFVGKKFKLTLVCSMIVPHIDFIWCALPAITRLNLSCDLYYKIDNKILYISNDLVKYLHTSTDIDGIEVPNILSI